VVKVKKRERDVQFFGLFVYQDTDSRYRTDPVREQATAKGEKALHSDISKNVAWEKGGIYDKRTTTETPSERERRTQFFLLENEAGAPPVHMNKQKSL